MKIERKVVMIIVCLIIQVQQTYAQTLYVDNATDCAGLTTCYISIQQAVNNAASDDAIHVFPGVYNEAIDLSLMGSDL